MDKKDIKGPQGKLGVLIVGFNGAISTTFLAGVMSIKQGKALPIGSLTQMATIRIGTRIKKQFPKIKDFVPLESLENLVFGGWDIRDENIYDAAIDNKVLDSRDIEPFKNELTQLHPMKGVFQQKYVAKLKGDYIKNGSNKFELMEMLREDIRNFKKENACDRLVMIWCGSTEIFQSKHEVHESIESFEQAMKDSHDSVSPSMLYAWAALSEGIPYINGAPNLTIDMPAMRQLAEINQVPLAGKDFKTGQTMIKTVIAPMLKARMIGLEGWFSSNILGNRDGEVLDDPDSFKTKEESKLSVIDDILQPDIYPDL
ncbi:MAG: inositol-3-phosphate synthase, partial [Bacteroidota bacterium]